MAMNTGMDMVARRKNHQIRVVRGHKDFKGYREMKMIKKVMDMDIVISMGMDTSIVMHTMNFINVLINMMTNILINKNSF